MTERATGASTHMKRAFKKKKGFTLQEVLLAMILVSILSVNMVVSANAYLNESYNRSMWSDLNTIFEDNIRFNIIDNQKLPSMREIEDFLIENSFKVETPYENDSVLYIINAKLGMKVYSIELIDDWVVIKAEYSGSSVVAKYGINETRTDVVVYYSDILEDTNT